MQNKGVINLAISTDLSGHAPHATLVASILRRTECKVHVRCWCRGFRPESFESDRLKVEFIHVDEAVGGKYPGHVSEAVFYRLRAIRDCPDWDRCLVLDYDHLALCDLAPLFDLDFGDALIGARLQGGGIDMAYAMKNWIGRPFPEGWEHTATHPYFLMGILLNLQGMRESGTWENLLAAQEAFGADEQLALTAASEGRILGYEKKWNLFPGMDWSKETYRGSPEGLIHWNGWPKPWHKHGDAWRKDLWESEASSWEHLRMGIWEKPESIEIASTDSGELRELAKRGWKIKKYNGWEVKFVKNADSLNLEDEFSDVATCSPTEIFSGIANCEMVRIAAYEDLQPWLERLQPLPDYLVLKGPRNGQDIELVKQIGYNLAFKLNRYKWPRGGPMPRVLEYKILEESEIVRDSEDLFLKLDKTIPALGIKGTKSVANLSNRASEGKVIVVIPAFTDKIWTHDTLHGLIRSARKHLFPSKQLQFVIIGDQQLARCDAEDIEYFQIDSEHAKLSGELEIFRQALERLNEVDYVLRISPDCIFADTMKEDYFVGTVALLHDGHSGKSVNDLPYERNKLSSAYIPLGEGQYYYSDRVLGGKPYEMSILVNQILSWVVEDERKGTHPQWGMEAYLNKALLGSIDHNRLDGEVVGFADWRSIDKQCRILRVHP